MTLCKKCHRCYKLFFFYISSEPGQGLGCLIYWDNSHRTSIKLSGKQDSTLVRHVQSISLISSSWASQFDLPSMQTIELDVVYNLNSSRPNVLGALCHKQLSTPKLRNIRFYKFLWPFQSFLVISSSMLLRKMFLNKESRTWYAQTTLNFCWKIQWFYSDL